MYEHFYNLREKPFTLLPDPGFLYLSDKHRMALTLLEYGLTTHAGFTVISGEIGAGKTTLIHHLLNNMDQDYTVGLISNTHRSFGELLQWILLAFNLDHKDMGKVEMYQHFVDFIINEYGQDRRTVLIIDEAQNMDAATLEELRMLSNVNADKNLALQVVLSGQRELRETLRRPDLTQLAQRITINYHLDPLTEDETSNYIRHRMEVAGGNPNTFTPRACAAIHRYSNGIPRLINLLCDTALVYGYVEEQHRIDLQLITDVARDKQQGGIFPTYEHETALNEDTEDSVTRTPAALDDISTAPGTPQSSTQYTDRITTDESTSTAHPSSATFSSDSTKNPDTLSSSEHTDYHEHSNQPETVTKKLRIVVCSVKENSRKYLSRLLESYGFEVIASLPLEITQLGDLDHRQFDALLVDREENAAPMPGQLAEILTHWQGPVLYNDAVATETSLQEGNPDFGQDLAQRVNSLVISAHNNPSVINQ